MNQTAVIQNAPPVNGDITTSVPVLAEQRAMAPSSTSHDLIERVIMNGASVDIVEKLMSMQERRDANMARIAFDTAMAAARAGMPVVIKNQRADFGSGSAAYKYEDLAAIAEAVGPVLARHGLSYRFRTGEEGNKIKVTCIVAHCDGYSEETSLSAPSDTSGKKNAIQSIGSAVTYLQRYTLKAALGLAASKDDDGHGYSNSGGRNEAVELITDKQAETLRDLIGRTGTNIDTFLKHCNVECIPDIPAESYSGAFANLQKRLRLQEQRAARNSGNDFPGDRP